MQSYLVRWVNVKAEHTISWSIRPDKKSINFGIFKHPGTESAPPPNKSVSTFEPPPTPGLLPADSSSQETQPSRNASSTATEKLKSIGLKPISWHGACEANRVSSGTYNVPQNEGGMYALVFDNTFSKTIAKSATFVLLTYPTNAPPQLNHHMQHVQGNSESSTSLKDALNARKASLKRQSSESVHQLGVTTTATGPNIPQPRSNEADDYKGNVGSNFFYGVLQKRRRKKHQGWARRFFSLDFSTSTLSYYQNRNTRAVRGAVPLSLAAIGANSQTRQISIDSGAEIWHLKVANQKDFEAWKQALEAAKTRKSPTTPASVMRLDARGRTVSVGPVNIAEEKQWSRIEGIAKRVQRSRDAAKSLAKDTDPKYFPLDLPRPSFARVDSNPISRTSSNSGSPSEQSIPNGYFNDGERKPFWKRKSSRERPMPGMFRSVSATPSTPSLATAPLTPIRTTSFAQDVTPMQSHPEEQDIHDRCISLLRDLDSIVAEFGHVVAEDKERRNTMVPLTMSRHSLDSQVSDEFYDAEGMNESQLLAIHQESDEDARGEEQALGSDEESASASEAEAPSRMSRESVHKPGITLAFPAKPISLTNLHVQRVRRREMVPAPTFAPPSLIGFLRKNVGKDLSTISMPVSANEPISLLQRVSEALEYSELLDEATNKSHTSIERLLYVTAFAISSLSSARVKDRSIRKPFNPMLGETFELVRDDKGFRFIAEKVSHRPVRLACQAESEKWTMVHSPLPSQKFWGKSAELTTEGNFRITLHATSDRFSWTPATSFLRNIIAGEKYVEPVGTMTVINEATGEKATVTFKSRGMFSGRSEDIGVQTYDAYGMEQPLGMTGKWTSSLTVTEDGQPQANEPPIWRTAELVPDAAKRYGFTTFAASLNEITPIETGKLPPTDSRLRPDQRAAEEGDLETAEALKAQLEEAQRERRRLMEQQGTSWTPKWFEKIDYVDDVEEVWVAKRGKNSYWEERSKGLWDGVEKVFDVDAL